MKSQLFTKSSVTKCCHAHLLISFLISTYIQSFAAPEATSLKHVAGIKIQNKPIFTKIN